MAAKRWCMLCAILLALFSFLIVLTVVIVDPFEIYHRALFYVPPYSSGTQTYSNAGVAKNFHYDSVIIGSSVTENCTPSVYDAALGGRFVKLCMNGGLSRDHARMMDAAFSHHTIARVVYGLDLFAYSQYYTNQKAPFPAYLYDDSLLNDVSYWFNRSVLFTYIPSALSSLGTPNEDDDRDRMYYWSPPDMPGRDALFAQVNLTDPLPEQKITCFPISGPTARRRLTSFFRRIRCCIGPIRRVMDVLKVIWFRSSIWRSCCSVKRT